MLRYRYRYISFIHVDHLLRHIINVCLLLSVQVSPGVTQHVVGGAPLTEQPVDAALLTPTTPDQQQGNITILVSFDGSFDIIV